jgi:hypothetical protein
MDLRHAAWLTGESVADPDMVLYEVRPYAPAQADRIIGHLCGLAGFDVAHAKDDPERSGRRSS